MAFDKDHRPCEPRARQPGQDENRRPPGIVRIRGDHPDRPVLQLHEGPRPDRRQAARFACHACRDDLLGALPRERLTTLRQFGGLQAYPSRTKDADVVDFSTGSVGLGAIAPSFAALTQRYAQAHFGATTSNGHRRQRRCGAGRGEYLGSDHRWRPPGHAQLPLGHRSESPEPRPRRTRRPCRAAQGLFRRQRLAGHRGEVRRSARTRLRPHGGAAFRECIDDMCNEEYQRLIREDGPTIRAKLLGKPGAKEIARCLSCTADDELPVLLANLGGHDLRTLLGAFERRSSRRDGRVSSLPTQSRAGACPSRRTRSITRHS